MNTRSELCRVDGQGTRHSGVSMFAHSGDGHDWVEYSLLDDTPEPIELTGSGDPGWLKGYLMDHLPPAGRCKRPLLSRLDGRVLISAEN